MSDPTSVFNEQAPAPATQPTQTNTLATDPLSDLLKGIVNEQGTQKYASLPDALTALKHSQEYIPQLKSQLAEIAAERDRLAAERAQAGNLEEIVSRLAAKQSQPEPTVNQPQGSGLDENAVLQLLERQLEQRQQQDVANKNLQQVDNALKAKYGEKAVEIVKQRASELGLTPQALGELSSKSPQAVLALFNAPGPSGPKPTTSSIIPPSFNTEQPTLEPPSRSMLAGATGKQQAEYWAKVREATHAKLGIKS